ncbi:MAG: hypothetical protein K2I60_00360, partial [Oscillospiraceae bacterium]|nr:hypothetical protein [Oscillospiraceae bacterium]
MKEKVFNPIKEFGGVFDGCGHTISNLKIQNNLDKGKDVELSFINTLKENAEIKNVTFDNYTVEGKSGIKTAAGLVVTNNGNISGVDIINGSINNIDKKANSAGFVLDNEEDGIIENCFVDMNNKDSNIKSGFVRTNHGKTTKCSTVVPVNSKDIAGGFCGSNSGEINDCKAEGSVKAKASNGITICGGFVGENSGMIKNCSSKGNVEGQEFTGGFVGINSDKGDISSCKAKCDVKSHTYIASINCGGFVGLDAGKIETCSFEGQIDGCVDSEKVVGIAVGVTVVVVLAITITYLFCKYKQSMSEKQKEDLNPEIQINDEETISNPKTRDAWNMFFDHVYTEYHKLQNPGFSFEQSGDHPEFLKYVFEKYKNKYLRHEDKNVRIWANIIDKIYYYESIKPII